MDWLRPLVAVGSHCQHRLLRGWKGLARDAPAALCDATRRGATAVAVVEGPISSLHQIRNHQVGVLLLWLEVDAATSIAGRAAAYAQQSHIPPTFVDSSTEGAVFVTASARMCLVSVD